MKHLEQNSGNVKTWTLEVPRLPVEEQRAVFLAMCHLQITSPMVAMEAHDTAARRKI
jgi:hypothetical protein